MLLTACAATPASDPTPSFDLRSSHPSLTAVTSPDATAEATGSPGGPAEPTASADVRTGLRPDSIAVTQADGLRVRAAPGTAAEQVSTLDAETLVFVLSGPASDPASPDLAWWQVVPYACSEERADCSYEPRLGWVSTGPGADWLRSVTPDCPNAFTADNPDAFYNVPELIACFRDAPIVLEGIVDYWCCRGITFGTTEPAWLAGDSAEPLVARLRVSEQEAVAWGPELHVNPGSGLTLGERGSIVRITGHFDDSAARTCRTTFSAEERESYPERLASASPEQAVYHCRLQFVLDSVDRLDFVPLPTHPPQG